MAPKKPALTLKDLQAAASIDDLPTMVPLLAEVERLTTDEADLSKAVQEAHSRLSGRPIGAYASSSPPPTPPATVEEFDRLTALARDGSRRLKRLQYELADAQTRVKEEQQRIRDEADALTKPMLLHAVTGLTKALAAAVPFDAEVRHIEQLRSKVQPTFGYSSVRTFNTTEDLAQLVKYVGQQAPPPVYAREKDRPR
jgi:hypothetical protein